MSIPLKSQKIIWAAAAGICSFPECNKKLFETAGDGAVPHIIGEMAHIKGDRRGSNRYDAEQSDEDRNNYTNLILLCPTHHTVIDKSENEGIYTVDRLISMRAAHEQAIAERTTALDISSKKMAATEIAALLAENHAVWQAYGPFSEFARKNPYNEEAHAIWMFERLSTIVPNNRSILKLLEKAAPHLSPADRALATTFRLHAQSYEEWVQTNNSYEGVTRFPQSFADMIERYADASA